jgi:hypothetical protein
MAINERDMSTFYTSGPKGYTDHSASAAECIAIDGHG